MGTIKKFEDLEMWRVSRTLAQEIFIASNKGSFRKDFSLRDQINRSAGSIADNIVEGFERGSRKEFIYFLAIAKGSAGELQSQLYRALDRNYLTQQEFNELKGKSESIGKMISGLIKYLSQSAIKGRRYEPE